MSGILAFFLGTKKRLAATVAVVVGSALSLFAPHTVAHKLGATLVEVGCAVDSSAPGCPGATSSGPSTPSAPIPPATFAPVAPDDAAAAAELERLRSNGG